jgi:hypothetical protein
MRIDTQKLKSFFKRTGQVKEVSWDMNTLKIKKTVQPDERLSFNETFKHIHNERQSN